MSDHPENFKKEAEKSSKTSDPSTEESSQMVTKTAKTVEEKAGMEVGSGRKSEESAKVPASTVGDQLVGLTKHQFGPVLFTDEVTKTKAPGVSENDVTGRLLTKSDGTLRVKDSLLFAPIGSAPPTDDHSNIGVKKQDGEKVSDEMKEGQFGPVLFSDEVTQRANSAVAAGATDARKSGVSSLTNESRTVKFGPDLVEVIDWDQLIHGPTRVLDDDEARSLAEAETMSMSPDSKSTQSSHSDSSKENKSNKKTEDEKAGKVDDLTKKTTEFFLKHIELEQVDEATPKHIVMDMADLKPVRARQLSNGNFLLIFHGGQTVEVQESVAKRMFSDIVKLEMERLDKKKAPDSNKNKK